MNILKCLQELILKNLGSILIACSIIFAALIYVNFNPYAVCMKVLSKRYDLTSSAIFCSGSR